MKKKRSQNTYHLCSNKICYSNMNQELKFKFIYYLIDIRSI